MSYIERCGPCDRSFQLCPAGLQIVRWVGADAGWEWQVLGFCPACGEQILCHTCRHERSARDLIDAGAAVVAVERPAELDEIYVRSRAPRLTMDYLAHSMDVLDDDMRFEVEFLRLRRRYGTRKGQP